MICMFNHFVDYDVDLPLDDIDFSKILHKIYNYNIVAICKYFEKRNYSLFDKKIKILIRNEDTEEELRYLIDKHKEKFINIDFKNSIYYYSKTKIEILPFLNKIKSIDNDLIIELDFHKCFELTYYVYNNNLNNKYHYIEELFSKLNYNINFKDFYGHINNETTTRKIIEYCIKFNNPFYKEIISFNEIETLQSYHNYFCHFDFDVHLFNNLFGCNYEVAQDYIYNNFDLCKFDFDLIDDCYYISNFDKEKFKLKQQEQLIKKNQNKIKSARY